MKIVSGLLTKSNLCQRIQFVDTAIKEVLKKTKNVNGTPLIEFLRDDTDFTPYLCKIARKYLSFYNSDEDRYDILIAAFEKLFLVNAEKAFKDFDGWVVQEDGTENQIAFEPYIQTLMVRAVIEQSKKRAEDYSRRKHINPSTQFDKEESSEEAFDRVVNKQHQEVKRHLDSDEEIHYEQLMKALTTKLKTKKGGDTTLFILDKLLLGFQKGEIAKELGVSATRVTDSIWAIKQLLAEIAQDAKRKGDSEMYNNIVELIPENSELYKIMDKK